MSGSDVRDVQSLEDLQQSLIRMNQRLAAEGQQLRAVVHHAQRHFGDEAPAYWRSQLRRAERDLTDAEERLGRKRAPIRTGDHVPATEERKQVRRAKARLDVCRQKQSQAKTIAIEMDRQCEIFQGPIADLIQQVEVHLPTAISKLSQLIERLRDYQQGTR